jgi:hypothetical protein
MVECAEPKFRVEEGRREPDDDSTEFSNAGSGLVSSRRDISTARLAESEREKLDSINICYYNAVMKK